ncbi:uncharacterized protein LOC132737800 isoform X2 [Ruditapes philippinarum]|nr:uncharacterized protein LOC132737800 isoform X2 [Ruditapes philippinarum]
MTQEDSIEDMIDRLTEFEASRALLPKRKPVTTEKVALSKKQEEEFSPKKKKKQSSSDSGKSVLKKTKVKQVKTDSKVQKEITETVKSVAESALLMQFPAENTADSNEENESSNTRAMQFPAENTADSNEENESSNTKSETWERKTRQKLDFSQRETISQGQSDTSLTKTWALCTGNNNPPNPPADILNFFKALGKPDVQSYISAFLQFYDTSEANTSEEQHENVWTEELSYVQMLPPLQNNQGSFETQTSVATQGQTNMQSLENPPHLSTTPLQDQSYTAHHAPNEHQTPQSAAQQQYSHTTMASNIKSPQQEFLWTCTPPSSVHQMHQSTTLLQEQQSPSYFQFQTPHSSTQQQLLNNQQPSTVYSSPQSTSLQSQVLHHPHQTFNKTSSESPQPQMLQSEASSEAARRSPRKHATDFVAESPDLNGKVRLLAKYDVKVNHRLLRKATRAASNASIEKAGYKLASKLICLLFSEQELAVSCGQGMRVKKGDVRPSLDSERLEVLRDYVIAWCRKNNKGTPKDRDINDAVTEQISYARKKCRTSASAVHKK